MDEKYIDLGFMVFALAFFIYIIWTVEAWEDKRYNRKVEEAREFGYKNSKLENEAQQEPEK